MAKIPRELRREIVHRYGSEAGERDDADPVVEFMKATRGELADLPEHDSEPRAWSAGQSAMLNE
jgi:hypothetical protein